MTSRILRVAGMGLVWSVILLAVALSAALNDRSGVAGASLQVPSRTAPVPVRNDVPKPGRELLVLRNHQLKKGSHDAFYQFSRDGLWPFFERIGARIVGQWKIIEPASAVAADRDEVYRMTRYASFEHWQATRGAEQVRLGGNGPAYEKGREGVQDRGDLEVGSRGAYFLEGVLASGGPYHMPGLPEQYEPVPPGQSRPGDQEIPVRVDTAQPGEEIVALTYRRIQKGSFDRFVDTTRAAIWPWEEKLGARPIGLWKLVYPTAPDGRAFPGLRFITTPNATYDEVLTLTRYAGRRHLDAMAPERAVAMGGNGPDWQAWRSALDALGKMTVSTSVELVQGFLYRSPPMFLPGLPEQYRRVK